MKVRAYFGVLAVSVAAALLAPVRAAELPKELELQLEKAKAAYEDACKKADERLLAGFAAEVEAVRKRSRLKAEEQQELIGRLNAEKETFEKTGTIPFSPPMRAAAITYIARLREAQKPAAAAYDKAIKHLTKAKDDAEASEHILAKKKFLTPKIVGVWDCGGVSFDGQWVWTLYADGTATSKDSTWKLDKVNLVIANRVPGAPLGGWIDTCRVTPDGQTFTAKNQKGATYKGKRIDPPK